MKSIAEKSGTHRFFEYARSRETVRLARESGDAAPWTTDPILQTYRFCNVFREDDRVTRWFRENFRDPHASHPDVVFGTIAFRFFNTIPTGEILLEGNLLTDWSGDRARQLLAGRRPLITGAYMVKTPLRKPKLEGLVEILDRVWEDREDLPHRIAQSRSLQRSHEILMEYPWIGPFMAYEFVTDLAHTAALRKATDIMTWANAGPGAIRGLSRIVWDDVGKNVPLRTRNDVMGQLLQLSKSGLYWPTAWRPWTMREVEHTLCEFDKYERARNGEGLPKQRFTPHEETS